MKRKTIFSRVLPVLLTVGLFALCSVSALAAGEPVEAAAETAAASVINIKAIIAGLAMALSAAVGAIAMSLAIRKSVEGIARQPEASGEIRTTMMLGLVFIETAIIYALLSVILIIFVL